MHQRSSVLVLILSVATAVGVLLYAFSLDAWGDTGGVVFPVVFLAAVVIAIASAVAIAKTPKHK
jgi:Na+-translocating ferredoxin:NAD+ oxidoreductase RnfE subunit